MSIVSSTNTGIYSVAITPDNMEQFGFTKLSDDEYKRREELNKVLSESERIYNVNSDSSVFSNMYIHDIETSFFKDLKYVSKDNELITLTVSNLVNHFPVDKNTYTCISELKIYGGLYIVRKNSNMSLFDFLKLVNSNLDLVKEEFPELHNFFCNAHSGSTFLFGITDFVKNYGELYDKIKTHREMLSFYSQLEVQIILFLQRIQK